MARALPLALLLGAALPACADVLLPGEGACDRLSECCPHAGDGCPSPLVKDLSLAECRLKCPFVPGWDNDDFGEVWNAYQLSGLVTLGLAMCGAHLWWKHDVLRGDLGWPFVFTAYLAHCLYGVSMVLSGAATACDSGADASATSCLPGETGEAMELSQFGHQGSGARCLLQGVLWLWSALYCAGAAMGHAVALFRVVGLGHTVEQLRAFMAPDWVMLLAPPTITAAVALAHNAISARTPPHLLCQPEFGWMEEAFNKPYAGVGALLPLTLLGAAVVKRRAAGTELPASCGRDLAVAGFVVLQAARSVLVVAANHREYDYEAPARRAAAAEFYGCVNGAGDEAEGEVTCKLAGGLGSDPAAFVGVWLPPLHVAATLALWVLMRKQIFGDAKRDDNTSEKVPLVPITL